MDESEFGPVECASVVYVKRPHPYGFRAMKGKSKPPKAKKKPKKSMKGKKC